MCNKQCKCNFESNLHLYAKELIKRSNKILLPDITIRDYIEYNKMDTNFLKDMNKWKMENNEEIKDKFFIKENIYQYKWIGNEMRIDDFIPDCIVEIAGKKLAIEICVTHEVDMEKEKKVKNSKIDMIEIYLSYIKEDMQDEGFDLDEYILSKAVRRWIFKTKVESQEKNCIIGYTTFGENIILNGNINSSNLKIKAEQRKKLVCKNCGKIFDTDDSINGFYLTNFEVDQECFEELMKYYYNLKR